MLFKAFIKYPAGVCRLLHEQTRWLVAIHAKLQFTGKKMTWLAVKLK